MKPNDERIADALERIAVVLEARENARSKLDRDMRKIVRLAVKAGKDPDLSAIVAKVLSEDESS